MKTVNKQFLIIVHLRCPTAQLNLLKYGYKYTYFAAGGTQNRFVQTFHQALSDNQRCKFFRPECRSFLAPSAKQWIKLNIRYQSRKDRFWYSKGFHSSRLINEPNRPTHKLKILSAIFPTMKFLIDGSESLGSFFSSRKNIVLNVICFFHP